MRRASSSGRGKYPILRREIGRDKSDLLMNLLSGTHADMLAIEVEWDMREEVLCGVRVSADRVGRGFPEAA